MVTEEYVQLRDVVIIFPNWIFLNKVLCRQVLLYNFNLSAADWIRVRRLRNSILQKKNLHIAQAHIKVNWTEKTEPVEF